MEWQSHGTSPGFIAIIMRWRRHLYACSGPVNLPLHHWEHLVQCHHLMQNCKKNDCFALSNGELASTTYPSILHPSNCASIHSSIIHPYIHPFTYPFTRLSIHRSSTHPSIHSLIHPLIHSPNCPSIHPWTIMVPSAQGNSTLSTSHQHKYNFIPTENLLIFPIPLYIFSILRSLMSGCCFLGALCCRYKNYISLYMWGKSLF